MLFRQLAAMSIFSLLAALCWGALTDNQGWWFFLPLCALLLIWRHYTRLSLPGVRLAALPGFVLFFVRQVVLGAIDVGWRALGPTSKCSPDWCCYPLRLSAPASQRLLASLISVLPGTCSAQIEAHPQRNQLLLHVLDQHADWQTGVAALELQLSRLLTAETSVGGCV
ncbi:Na+/H+ antiporter subunit E [Arsukibacterium sp.]|uniref:Na+/H+ antiporter subunit E n=1 Tax=Arsukibacterium sp. TaxID=1977258 RepID=UPI0035629528